MRQVQLYVQTCVYVRICVYLLAYTVGLSVAYTYVRTYPLEQEVPFLFTVKPL